MLNSHDATECSNPQFIPIDLVGLIGFVCGILQAG
jgi:hypothetical protein